MKAVDVNTTLIEGYLQLLENLSPGNKLDLISKLTLSVKTDVTDKKKKSFEKSFGAFESTKSAEEIIAELNSSRMFDRQTESF